VSKPLRLAAFAVPLSGNKGSASMLLGLRDAFATARVDARFEVFSYYPERDRCVAEDFDNLSVHPGHPKDIFFRLLPALLLPHFARRCLPRRWQTAVDALDQCDAVLLMGGTTFADSMLYKVPWNVLAALPGYWRRKPTVFLSQTLGPCRNWFNRTAARWTLRRAVEVHGRGRRSAACARNLGISWCNYQPDLSFSMKVPEFLQLADRIEALDQVRQAMRETGRQAVGVAPNTIVLQKARRAGRDYIQFLTTVVRSIHQLGYLPIIIPHSYAAEDRTLHNNDRALCRELLTQIPNDVSCHYVDHDLTAPQLRSLIGELELLVASRFHSMISALAMGVPPLTFGWGHHKYREVLAEFDAGGLYVAYDQLDEWAVRSQLQHALDNRNELSDRIRLHLADVTRQSDAIVRRITRVVETFQSVRSGEPVRARWRFGKILPGYEIRGARAT
jgi:polysaccharide pyruvyl transferase WcaK-like protein